MAYGCLLLKPQEFWSLQPKHYVMMVRGYLMRREIERSDKEELMHLQRMTVAMLMRIGQMFQKNPKKINPEDVWPLPMIDEQLSEAKKKRAIELEKKAERVLDKYKKMSGNGG